MAIAVNRVAWIGWIATILWAGWIMAVESGPDWRITGPSAGYLWQVIYVNLAFAVAYIVTFSASSR